MPHASALADGYRINQKVKHTFHAEEVQATVVEEVFDGKAYRLRIDTGRFAGQIVLVNARVLDRSNPDLADKGDPKPNARNRAEPVAKNRPAPNTPPAPFLANPQTADPVVFQPGDHWNVPEAQGKPKLQAGNAKPSRIVLRSKIPYPHGRVELSPSYAGDRVIALASNGPFADDKSIRLEVLSFGRRSSLGATKLDTDSQILALSPDGTTALVGQQDRSFGLPQTPLTLLDLTRPSTPKTLHRFRVPGLDHSSAPRARAWLIDAEHLLLYANRQLTVYRTDTLKPVYTTEHFLISREAPLSPDRSLMLINQGQTLHILNARTGEPQARANLPGVNLDTARISPGHRYIAAFSAGVITVLDAQTGQTLHALAMPEDRGNAAWIDDRFVSIAGYVFDAQLGLPVLRPTRPNDPKKPDANRRPFLGQHATPMQFSEDRHPRDNQRVVVTRTPYSTAPLIRAAQQLDPTNAFVLEAGSPVSISVEFGDAAVRKDVRQALERAVANAGFVLDPNAPSTLAASLKTTPQQQKMERSSTGEIIIINVTENTYTLALEQAGQTLWQNQGTYSGQLTGRFDGRTTNQELQRLATERGQPRADFFTNRRIPKRVLSPEFLDQLPY
ncbi:MAG: hypothetical protein AAGI68_07970 [Planctomycetota bacterium]